MKPIKIIITSLLLTLSVLIGYRTVQAAPQLQPSCSIQPGQGASTEILEQFSNKWQQTFSQLGCPTANAGAVTSSFGGQSGLQGWRQPFDHGYIYTYQRWERWITVAIYGNVSTEYRNQDEHNGNLGFPISDQLAGIPIAGLVENVQVQRFEGGQIYYHLHPKHDVLPGYTPHDPKYITETTRFTSTLMGYQLPCKPGTQVEVTTTHSEDSLQRNAYDIKCKDNSDARAVYSPIHGTVKKIYPTYNGGAIIIESLQDNSCVQLLHLQALDISENDEIRIGQRIGRYNAPGSVGNSNFEDHVHLAAQIRPQNCESLIAQEKENPILFKELGYVPPHCIERSPDNERGGCGTEIEVTSGQPACLSNSSTFCDVPEWHIFYPEVEALVTQRNPPITAGCSGSFSDHTRRFCAEDFLTRGAMSKFIIRAIGEEPEDSYYNRSIPGLPDFSDVPNSHIFFKYIKRIVDPTTNPLKTPLGEYITTGFSDGTFRPDGLVTRGEMSKIIINALYIKSNKVKDDCRGLNWNYSDSDPDSRFSDVEYNNPFYKYIRCMQVLGIASGYSDGTFKPDKDITRVEAAKFIAKLIGMIQPSNQESSNNTNNTPSGALPYTSPSTYLSVPGGDTDWLRFNVPATTDLAAADVRAMTNSTRYRLYTADAGLNADVRIEVYDTNATTLLAAAEGLGQDGGASLFWTPPAPGTFYIRFTNTNPFVQEGTGLNFVAEPCSGTGIICNGDFEHGTDSWTVGPSESLASPGHTSSYALKSVQTSPAGSSASWKGIRQTVLATPGQLYEFGFSVKGENTAGTHGKIEWYNNNNQKIITDYPLHGPERGSFDWMGLSTYVTAPPGAATALVVIWHGVDGQGNVPGSTLWIDDVIFAPVPSCPTGYICNGDYEQGLKFWLTNESAAIGSGRTGQGLQLSNLAGKFVAYQPLSGVFAAGHTYQASAWCRADLGKTCKIYLGGEENASKEVAGNGQWQQIKVRLTLTKDSRLYLKLYNPVPGSVVSYDDIQVTELSCDGGIICNGDFEQGLNYWEYQQSATATITAGRTGQGAKVVSGGTYWSAIQQRLSATFEGGKTYRASVWCQADVGEMCQMFFGDASVAPRYENVIFDTIPGNGGWQQLQVWLTPSHNEQLDIWLYSPTSKGEVIYDDVTIEEVACGSLVCNGNFEQGLDFWQHTANETVVSELRQQDGLQRQLEFWQRPLNEKITTTGRTGQGLEVSYNGDLSEALQVLPQIFKGGKTYRASVWCKADVGEKCRIRFGDAAPTANSVRHENWANLTLPGNGNWQQLQVSLTPTHDERLDIWLYSQVVGSSVIYDDVEVVEVDCSPGSPCYNNITANLNLNSGAVSSSYPQVRATITGTSQIGAITEMKLAEQSNLSTVAWEPFTSQKQLTLADGQHTFYLMVRDEKQNQSAVVSATITVKNYGPPERVSINNGAIYVGSTQVNIGPIIGPQYATEMAISNDGGFLCPSCWWPYADTFSWQLAGLPGKTVTAMVYVTFKDADGHISAIVNDSIYVDLASPTGNVAILNSTESGQVQNTANFVTLQLQAQDDLGGSGLAGAWLSSNADMSNAVWSVAPTNQGQWIYNWSSGERIYAQFVDKVGNQSSITSVGGNHQIFLPTLLKNK